MSRGSRVGRDPLEVWRHRRLSGDKRSRAVLGDNQTLAFQTAVQRPCRIHVHARRGGQIANSGQPVASRKAAAEDQRTQAPGKAEADRQLLVLLGAQATFVPGARLSRLLCHCASTLTHTP